MEPPPAALAADTALLAAAHQLRLSARGALPVLGADQHFYGYLTVQTLAGALDGDNGNTPTDRTVRDLVEVPAKITTNSTITDALDALAGAGETGLPVLDPTGRTLAGWITHRAIITALHPDETPTTVPQASPPTS
jgi:CIC family chloride channel protein